MSNIVKVLGVDPSLRNFGFAFGTVDLESGDINVGNVDLIQPSQADKATKKVVRRNSDDLRRARFLHKGLQTATKQASIAFVEVPVGSQSARSMASYGICVGILASCNIPIVEVTPTEVKLASVGNKTATKESIIKWATELYPDAGWKTRKLKGEIVLTADNEHMADAVAAIHAGLITEQFATMAAVMSSIAS